MRKPDDILSGKQRMIILTPDSPATSLDNPEHTDDHLDDYPDILDDDNPDDNFDFQKIP